MSANAAWRDEGLLRRFGWSAVSTGTAFVTSAVSSIAISRLVDPAEYGRASVMMSSWGFLGIPIIWCSAVIVRFGPVELERAGRVSETLGTRLLFAIPALVLLGVLVPFVIGPWAGWSGVIIGLTCAFLVVSLVQDLAHGAGATVQGFRPIAVANVLNRGLPALVVMAPAVIPFSLRAEHLLAASVGGVALGSSFLLYSFRGVVRIGRPNRKLFGAMWRYVAPALIGVPAISVIAWIDPLVLSRFVSRAEVGHYQLAYLVMTVSAMAATSVSAVLEPELVRAKARGDAGKLALYHRFIQPRLVQVFGLAAFAVACVAEPLTLLVVGPQFAPSARIVGILCVAAGLQMATSTLYAVVTTTDGMAAGNASKVIQAAVNVGGDVLLGARWGAMGIGLANVIAWLVGGVLLSLLMRRKVRLHLSPWALLAALAPLVLVFVVASPSLWSRFAAGGALGAAAAVLAAGLVRRRGAVLALDA